MTERALITGAAGFIGYHLAVYLVREGLEIHGMGRPGAHPPENWPGQWYAGDVTDAEQISSIVRSVKPNYIFHLAALIRSDSLIDLLAVNVMGTQNVLDAVITHHPQAHILVTGSAAEYGYALPEELPIRENNPLRPVTPYGISKVAQSLLAAQYAYRHGLFIIRTRTFNLTGPGEPETQVCSAFVKQIAAIEKTRKSGTVRVGNLSTQRDLVDVRDAVKAYWLAIQHCQPGEVYNVCSGKSVYIREILEILLELARVPIRTDLVSPDWDRTDVPVQQGNREKLEAATRWTPSIPLKQSLQELMDKWRMAFLL